MRANAAGFHISDKRGVVAPAGLIGDGDLNDGSNNLTDASVANSVAKILSAGNKTYRGFDIVDESLEIRTHGNFDNMHACGMVADGAAGGDAPRPKFIKRNIDNFRTVFKAKDNNAHHADYPGFPEDNGDKRNFRGFQPGDNIN